MSRATIACAAVGAAALCGTVPATPAVAAPSAPPRVVQFDAPERFWCLVSRPRQAQVTIGWSVPSATRVTVELDGRPLRSGLRKRAPFHVLAGSPSGIGTTVVFGCRTGARHTITIRWRVGDSKPATRTLRIRKARG